VNISKFPCTIINKADYFHPLESNCPQAKIDLLTVLYVVSYVRHYPHKCLDLAGALESLILVMLLIWSGKFFEFEFLCDYLKMIHFKQRAKGY
jgi:hypothetical protein